MVWLLQPKDFVYGQSYARLSYRIFYTLKTLKKPFLAIVKPHFYHQKILQKVGTWKDFFSLLYKL